MTRALGQLRRGTLRRHTLTGMLSFLFFMTSPPVQVGAADDVHFFRIGSAATTGTYFEIGGALASALSKPPNSRACEHGGSCGVPGLVAEAEATQGSVENVLKVGSAQIESALAQSDVAYWAYTGGPPTAHQCKAAAAPNTAPTSGTALLKKRGPITGLRALAALYPEDIHIVVRADSALHNLADLAGRRVALGEAQSGTLADARLVLDAAGLDECALNRQFLPLSLAVEALSRGNIDAFFVVAGAPTPAVADLAAQLPIRLLPITGETAARLISRRPYFSTDRIAKASYRGIDQDVPTVSVTALWVVGAQVPDDLAYAVTQALWRSETLQLLQRANAVGNRIRLADALKGVVIPFHPGAARYYREVGLALPPAGH